MIQNQTSLALKHANWNNLKGEKGILSSMGESFRKHCMTYEDWQSSYLLKKKKQLIYGEVIESSLFPFKELLLQCKLFDFENDSEPHFIAHGTKAKCLWQWREEGTQHWEQWKDHFWWHQGSMSLLTIWGGSTFHVPASFLSFFFHLCPILSITPHSTSRE